MLSKSIKHEFRATARVMLLVYLAILSLSVVAHFTMKVFSHGNHYGTFLRLISGVTTAVFFIGLAAAGIGTIALTVIRFDHSMLSDEGYLTMTLPVSTHKLISAKLLVSIVWYVLTTVAVLAALLIALLDSGDWGGLFKGTANFLQAVWEALPTLESGMVAGLIVCGIELFICLILGAARTSLLIYAAMAIGHSFNKHKALLSGVFVYVFFHITQIVSVLSGFFIIGKMFEKYERAYALDYLREQSMTPYILIIGVALLLLAAACVIYYFLTHWFLTMKLNLE